jgi:hypothetical protein
MENYPTVAQLVEDGQPVDRYPFPSESAKTMMLGILIDPKAGLAKLMASKLAAESRLAQKKSRPMTDDFRRQFDILDRRDDAIPRGPAIPGGPDLGNDPEEAVPIPE